MKTVLAIFMLCLGLCLASNHPTECGELQRLMVKTQWVQAYGFGLEREDFDLEIWNHIFDGNDAWRSQYFSRVRGENNISPEFRAHAARISGAFDMMINFLHFPDVLHQQQIHLAHYHAEMKIPDAAFDVFRYSVMEAVHNRVGRCFDHDAWELCTAVLSSGIQNAA